MTETIVSIPAEHIRNVFGHLDNNLKSIERAFHVDVTVRGDELMLSGDDRAVQSAGKAFKQLVSVSESGSSINQQMVNYTIAEMIDDAGSDVTPLFSSGGDIICHNISGKPVKPKTKGQLNYVSNIRDRMIVFGVGPAGTGKTYLAMAMAISAFKNAEVGRIILTRPAIEAGEKLGFLPGDLQSKIDPYLRPLYDALYDIMGADSFQKNMERGLIEVAPLAYMRGRTLDNSFIVLDEAQNTTPAQMKMFLTRIGFGSKVIVTGDLSQKDLPAGTESGLDVAMKILADIPDIGICRLSSRDVVRHPLVQQIVDAYESYEKKTDKSSRARAGALKKLRGQRRDGLYRKRD